MAVWYEVEKSENGINHFLDSNWGFHDFRPERVEYIPGKDMVEIFLKYDTGDQGVLLRFVWIKGMRVNTQRDYDAEWLSGSVAFILDNGAFIWLDDDEWEEESALHLDEMKTYTTWVESERMMWAITDGDGNPVEMPPDRKDQVWNAYGKRIEKHFDLKEFQGDWESILKPWYDRKR